MTCVFVSLFNNEKRHQNRGGERTGGCAVAPNACTLTASGGKLFPDDLPTSLLRGGIQVRGNRLKVLHQICLFVIGQPKA